LTRSSTLRKALPSVAAGRALAADLYALTHRGNAGDAAFYRRFCAGASSVLELGCGSGRLLPALVAPGRRVVGLELDQALRRLARRTAPSGVELTHGDMRKFELGSRFERVVIPFTAFYCLLTREDAIACLRSVRRHLAEGGLLAFDAYAADGFHAESSPRDVDPEELSELVSFEHRGRRWDVFEKSSWDKRRQRLDVTYLYRSRAREVAIEIPQRYWLSSQVAPLLERAGLELRSLHGGFRKQRFSKNSPLLVVTAERAG
jgi:SAM-dependent methyltransferase